MRAGPTGRLNPIVPIADLLSENARGIASGDLTNMFLLFEDYSSASVPVSSHGDELFRSLLFPCILRTFVKDMFLLNF